ncbi:hypothetical protein MesoLj131c_63620 [Mesorhizobium sp. 131-3-5]|uniref:DUF6074 family protein n=1 Tax=Mesorhizobium sp. 131-3-5 TaxID=2744520 RepID=UPI001925748D|nr:DUF6074 family protein [Mesorhizobium sp. 131-3-5]BCH12104.1 hypothetical protein MesoLj131c_63620 [Mesorhizobium sp. 131-3-5]
MAIIIAFPLTARTQLVRETILALQNRHGPAADRFWRSVLNRQTGILQVSGVLNAEEIDLQLSAFASTVITSMQDEFLEPSGDEASEMIK